MLLLISMQSTSQFPREALLFFPCTFLTRGKRVSGEVLSLQVSLELVGTIIALELALQTNGLLFAKEKLTCCITSLSLYDRL
jgi:hypothetical protein